MPTCRGISTSLQTQYDSRCVPEFPLSWVPVTSSLRQEHGSSDIDIYKSTAPLERSDSSNHRLVFAQAAEVYVPSYPGSQFWVYYQCSEPPQDPTLETRFLYFKLFFNGACVLSWGVGEENGWAGKVSFGIYQSGADLDGRRILEKRGFFFDRGHELDNSEGGFEIQVFRSKGRRREETRFEKFDKNGVDGGSGFRMESAGHSKKHEAKRMYTYALIDPVDQPYAVFKYRCRAKKQLRHDGLASGYYANEMSKASPDSSPRSRLEQSPPAPAIPGDHLSTRRLSFSPDLKLNPSYQNRGGELSPVQQKRLSWTRDAVDLVHKSTDSNLHDLETGGSVRDPPIGLMSKPLPDVPDPSQPAEGKHSITRSTSNVAGTLKDFVQNGLKRRINSRDDKTSS